MGRSAQSLAFSECPGSTHRSPFSASRSKIESYPINSDRTEIADTTPTRRIVSHRQRAVSASIPSSSTFPDGSALHLCVLESTLRPSNPATSSQEPDSAGYRTGFRPFLERFPWFFSASPGSNELSGLWPINWQLGTDGWGPGRHFVPRYQSAKYGMLILSVTSDQGFWQKVLYQDCLYTLGRLRTLCARDPMTTFF